jgi:tetratricopeptide (TPR) repeat protein
VKRIILFLLGIILLAGSLLANPQKIAILNFEKNDRQSDYVANAMMKRDFVKVFNEFENFELINLKTSKKVFEKSGFTNLSYIGKDDIFIMGEELDADIILWGSVSSISSTDFKVTAKIFSMKSKDVVIVTFNVKKDSKKRQESMKENLVVKIEEFIMGEVEKLMSIALQHFNSKNYSQAEESFLNLINVDSKNKDAFFYLGLLKYIEENYEKSIEYYNKGLEIEPSDKNILDYLSRAYIKLEQYENAVETLIVITETEEDNCEIWLRIGNIYSEIEYYDEAQEAYEKALEIDTEYDEAYYVLGVLFFEQEMYDEAIEPLEIATDAFPEVDHLQKKLAKCYYKTGKLDSAINKYKQVIVEQPDNVNAYMNLAGAYRETSQNQEALDILIQLKELQPDMPKVYQRLADVYIALEEYSKAEQSANKAIELDASLYESYMIFSSINQNLGYKKYEMYLDYEEKYQDKSIYYGEKADELVEKRDKVKSEAYAYFVKTEHYLNEAEARTDIPSVLKDIKKNRSLLKQLKDATKAGGF